MHLMIKFMRLTESADVHASCNFDNEFKIQVFKISSWFHYGVTWSNYTSNRNQVGRA